MFPQQLDDSQAFNLAAALLDGFDRHYRLLHAQLTGAPDA